MRKFIFLFTVLAFQSNATDYSSAELEKIMSKDSFTSHDGMLDWIKKSPKITKMIKDSRDENGNGEFTTKTGSDCNRDGKMDESVDCVYLYQALAKHYNVKVKIK